MLSNRELRQRLGTDYLVMLGPEQIRFGEHGIYLRVGAVYTMQPSDDPTAPMKTLYQIMTPQHEYRLSAGSSIMIEAIEHLTLPDFLSGQVQPIESLLTQGLLIQSPPLPTGFIGWPRVLLHNGSLQCLTILAGMFFGELTLSQSTPGDAADALPTLDTPSPPAAPVVRRDLPSGLLD